LFHVSSGAVVTHIILATVTALLLAIGANVIPPVAATPHTGPDPGPKRLARYGPVTAVCFSPDGKWVLTADYLCYASLWRIDGKAEKPVWTVRVKEPERVNADDDRERKGHTTTFREYGAIAAAFAADGKRLFVAWSEGVAELDRENGKILRTTKFPTTLSDESPQRLVFLPGSDECVFYGDERLVRFDFKANKRHDKFDLRLPEWSGLNVALSPDGKRVLAYEERAGYLTEWNLNTGELCKTFGNLADGFEEAGYTPDGESVWLWRWNRRQMSLQVLDRLSGKQTEWAKALSKYAGWLWFSPDGKRALGLPSEERENEKLEILRVEDGKVLQTFSSGGLFYNWRRPWAPEDKLMCPRPGLVVFSPDTKSVLLTGSNGTAGEYWATLGVWDLETGKRLQTLTNKP
jgi:WD40 repeat protein